tara:strand:- start:7828 stop:7962 length:135 start_codon:yes stop_codon:yes gene_type:complete
VESSNVVKPKKVTSEQIKAPPKQEPDAQEKQQLEVVIAGSMDNN